MHTPRILVQHGRSPCRTKTSFSSAKPGHRSRTAALRRKGTLVNSQGDADMPSRACVCPKVQLLWWQDLFSKPLSPKKATDRVSFVPELCHCPAAIYVTFPNCLPSTNVQARRLSEKPIPLELYHRKVFLQQHKDLLLSSPTEKPQEYFLLDYSSEFQVSLKNQPDTSSSVAWEDFTTESV